MSGSTFGHVSGIFCHFLIAARERVLRRTQQQNSYLLKFYIFALHAREKLLAAVADREEVSYGAQAEIALRGPVGYCGEGVSFSLLLAG
jgi:hypothetical protein